MTPSIKGEFEMEINNSDQAKSIISTLNGKEKKLLLEALNTGEENSEKTEQKESLEKSLEFEKDTFKIDSTGWKEPTEGKFAGNGVKVNPAGDVIENLETGEQLFIDYDKFLGYVAEEKGCTPQEVEKKYLMTKEEFKEKMKDIPKHSDRYKDFYNNDIKGHLAGYWNPSNKRFFGVGGRSHMWVVDGYDAAFGAGGWFQFDSCKSFGFSGRLLKN